MQRQSDKKYTLNPKSSLEKEDYLDGLQTSSKRHGPSLKVVSNGGSEPTFEHKAEGSPQESLERRDATKSKFGDNGKDEKAHLLLLLKQAFPTARILCYIDNSAWLYNPVIKTPREIGALCVDPKNSIIDETVGIIFLGTPHQGARQPKPAAILAPVLRLFGLVDATLISCLTEHNSNLSNLADNFDELRSQVEKMHRKIRIIAFYETKPALGRYPLVSRDSAILHADALERWPVNTDHSNLNKCSSLQDSHFINLTKAIERLRCPSRLQLADSMIHQYYNADKLKITRLSGQGVSLSHCYINLAIEQERLGQESVDPEERNISDTSFPLKEVEDLDSSRALELKTIFDQRKGCDGAMVLPRRIMIRGRAGVGKSTLCKKIVHEFVHDETWRELFHRILWIPLRHLARTDRMMKSGYCLTSLFEDEFFPEHGELAKELARDWGTKCGKTLFVLDGLDEVSQVLESEQSGMKDFIKRLLEQPNLIVTSRSHVSHPALGNVDLRAEVLGFHPDQVVAYLEADPKMCSRIEEFQTWLNERWVLRGLVRTPILLDALCLVWDSPHRKTISDTMTGVYIAITRELRSKDIKKLDFDHSANLLDAEIKSKFQSVEIILEHLAFSGLISNLDDFTTDHRNKIAGRFRPPKVISLNETLGRISFMRSSDGPEQSDREYHFMHRTFQEFFAAQYFVRQWICSSKLEYALNAGEPNEEHRPTHPAKFLERYKYTAQYDVFWRLVTGLIATEHGSHLERFFAALEQEPFDLLGPAHQLLTMHCLAEVDANTKLPVRPKLEERLSEWAQYEVEPGISGLLAREPEFPESSLFTALHTALSFGHSYEIMAILRQVSANPRQLSERIELLILALFMKPGLRRHAKIALSTRASLSMRTACTIKALLEDTQKNGILRIEAASILRRNTNLVKEMLADLKASLESEDQVLVIAAAMALGSQVNLATETEEILLTQAGSNDKKVRSCALEALHEIETISEKAQSFLLQMVKAHPNEETRQLAALSLLWKGQLSYTTLRALVEAIADDHDSMFANTGVNFLSVRYRGLPGPIKERLVEDFQCVPRLRRVIRDLLNGQDSLSDNTCTALRRVIGDNSNAEDYRLFAIQSVYSMKDRPWPIVVALTKLVTDCSQSCILRETAASILCREDKSPATTEDLHRLLQDDNDGIKYYALDALICREPGQSTTERLSDLLRQQNNFRGPRLVVRCLQDRMKLEQSEEEALVRIINDATRNGRDPCLRGNNPSSYATPGYGAARVLARQLRLSEKAQDSLLRRLLDLNNEWKVRHLAAIALESHLSPEKVKLLLQALDKRDLHDVCQITSAMALVPDLVNVILKLIGSHADAEQQTETAAPASGHVKLITGLYEGLLDRSFMEQVTLCVYDNACIIDQPQGRHIVPLSDLDLASLRRHIAERQQLINKRTYKLWCNYG
ncbi:hypothetical protein MY3296_004635 [Beauveria thailandica]